MGRSLVKRTSKALQNGVSADVGGVAESPAAAQRSGRLYPPSGT